MIHFLAPRGDDFTFREYLGNWGRGLAGRASILHYEDFASRPSLPAGAYVLAALDRFDPPALSVFAGLCDELSQAGPDVRLLNAPSVTLQRLPLLEELHRMGLNRHRAIPAAEDARELKFPVFLHEEHLHNGALTPLLETPEALERALGQLVVRGRRLRNLLVVEFCETADADGVFRKYSAFIVGDRILARSMERGRDWMLKHAVSEFTESALREEQDYVFQNPHEQALRRIFEIARVEYGRIDYSLKDGEIETWEINLHPTIGRGPGESRRRLPAELEPLKQETKTHFYRLFQEAFEAIDVGGEAPRSIPIRNRPESVPQARARNTSGLMAAVRNALRPFRSLIEPLIEAISPLAVRLARRRR